MEVVVEVIVLCGLPLSGKTFWAQVLSELVHAPLVTIDDIRIEYWGSGRKLSLAEHLYKNELARNRVKQLLVIAHAENVVFEAVMLTHTDHQKPFLEMIQETQELVRKIGREQVAEHGARDAGTIILAGDVDIVVKCIYCVCSEAVALERLAHRAANPGNNDLFTPEAYFFSRTQFESPLGVFSQVLVLDTSDESVLGDEQNKARIRAFFGL